MRRVSDYRRFLPGVHAGATVALFALGALLVSGCDASQAVLLATNFGGRAIVGGIDAITDDLDLIGDETAETRIPGETRSPGVTAPSHRVIEPPLNAERAGTAHGGF